MVRRTRRQPPRPAPSDRFTLEIRDIGVMGDGIAALPDGRTTFIDGALPGEIVEAEVTFLDQGPPRGRLVNIVEASPARRDPPCPIAGLCGGCMVQHLEDGFYAGWKTRSVSAALDAAGLDSACLEPMRRTGEQTRRRAVWQFRLGEGRLLLGYAVRRGNRIIDATTCLLLEPALQSVMDGLRRELPALLPGPVVRRGRILATSSDSGPDVLLELDHEPDLDLLQGFSALAERLDLARLSWRNGARGEATPAAVRRQPTVKFGDINVAVPAGAFLQASGVGEALIQQAVSEALAETDGPVLDLYAGLGSLSCPVAATRPVHAIEGMERMAMSLASAARRSAVASRLTTETRDLDRRPVIASELDRYSAVILDPPRTGAKRQVEELTRCEQLSRLVYVSCSADSFARDTTRLVKAGWRLAWVRPIDQFLYSDQTELVARLDR
ncbi:MAG: TRAM domain-containing protein [Rhodospirillales bacterium]